MRRFFSAINGNKKLSVHPSARVTISDAAKHLTGRIQVGRDSTLKIEDGAVIASDLTIGDACSVVLKSYSRVQDTDFRIEQNGNFELGEGAIINSPVSKPSAITINNGTLRIERRAHVMSTEILVRFGGQMTIGRYTGIAYRSEIRCEERVEIGSYGMISYDVCIYDTNTHSVDWRERRKRIEACYPEGVMEVTKPATSPVLIGDDVWIGKEVAITKGANIGHRCIIGIRTIIGSETVPDDSIVVAGKPRIIPRRLDQNDPASVIELIT
ncbi:MAG: hypothetical protein C5B55_09690 [Blastocatellia bacterium]|nr:MAG: hypothetical protein C5B55_09690 [Blastocatellia bacterium]